MSISRPESRQSYQDHYRRTATRPKMALAERYLAEYQRSRDRSGMAMAAAVAQFRLASECPAQVVPHIHDLWAEYVFKSATMLDPGARPAFLADRFLKPLADFTDDERRFEEMLAIADLCTLAKVMGGLVIHPPIARQPLPASAALRALACIAASDDLLAAAARPIYDNWLKVRRFCDMSDPSDRAYEYLSSSNQQKLLMNIRADVLATLLFCAEDCAEDQVNWLAAGPRNIPSPGLVKDAALRSSALGGFPALGTACPGA